MTEPEPPKRYKPEIGDRVIVNAMSRAYCALPGKVVAFDDGRETGEGVMYAVSLDKYADYEWFKASELDPEDVSK